jgi:predicted MFS family arabinose efflux permease
MTHRSLAAPQIRNPLGRIFVPFGAGYFLSYVFRTVNGPFAAQLAERFHLGPSQLGLLTSVYFLTFAAFQLPGGLLIDRYGPRRVQAVLLTIAAAGALVCGLAPDWPTLMLGRALLGLGSAGAFVAGVKVLMLWLPPERRALGNSALVMCGGLGAMSSTAPLEALAGVLDLRSIFLGLAAASLVVAAAVARFVPDAPRPARLTSAAEMVRGLRLVAVDRRFWRVAPLSALVVGAAFAIHGLWAARWLADVAKLSQPAVGVVLLAMGASLTLGALTLGLLATHLRRRGVPTATLFAAASLVLIGIEALIAGEATLPPILLFAAFAIFGAITVLSFTMMGELFPSELAGRANGALNVLHMGAAFAIQAGIGTIVALWPVTADGHPPATGYDAAIGTIIALQAAALLWFALPAIRLHRLPVLVRAALSPAFIR